MMIKERLQLFLRIVKTAYLGESLNYKGRAFRLEPTIVPPYDFIRKISKPQSEFERLLKRLNKGFKNEARTELYRAKRGWIDQGARGYARIQIRKVDVGGKSFLLPVLSPPAAGIDTRSIENTSTVLAFCFFSDPNAGYAYLEKHLKLPKAKDPVEFKWSKLASEWKKVFLEKFEQFLNLFCNAVLIVHTNAFISSKGKRANIFINLIDGCFTGFEHLGKQRGNLRQAFFNLANKTPIHCDADFSPLTPAKVVRFLVHTLAKQDHQVTRPFTPMHVPLKSHESEPIQIADMIVGSIAHEIVQTGEPLKPFSPLFFDVRKIKHLGKQTRAKAYFWVKRG